MAMSLAAFWQGGAQTAGAAGTFEPFLPGLIVLLPLLGFIANGVLAMMHGRDSADAVRAGGELDLGPRGERPMVALAQRYG